MSARTTARESSMPLPLREDSEGVASTVATMFTLLVILLFIQLTVVEVVPAQEYNAEWATSRAAIDAFERLRLATQLAAVDGSRFSSPFPSGPALWSPFSRPNTGPWRLALPTAPRSPSRSSTFPK